MHKFLSILGLSLGLTGFTMAQIQPPVLVSPNDNAKEQDVNVVLNWNPSLGGAVAGYEVEIDTNADFSTKTSYAPFGTTAATSELSFGKVYRWRVRAVDVNGGTSGWSDTNTFTTFHNEFVFPSNAPVAKQADGEFGILSNAINGETFTVGSISLVAGLDFAIGADTSITAINLSSAINANSTEVTASATNNAVSVVAVVPGEGGNSIVLAYTGSTSDVSIDVMANGSNGASAVQVRLRWGNENGIVSYDYQVGTDPTFTSNTTNGNVTINNALVRQLMHNTVYYWRVRTKHAADISGWSKTNAFITPNSFELLSPEDTTAELNPATLLEWQNMAGHLEYHVTLDVNPTIDSTSSEYKFSTVDANDFGATDDISYTAVNLRFGTTYYWRARGKNDNSISGWSPIWSFSVRSNTELVSPADGSEAGVSPELEWEKMDGVSAYEIQYSDQMDFSTSTSTIALGDTLTTKVVFLEGFEGKMVYWRVRGMHVRDTSDWTDTWSLDLLTVGTEDLDALTNTRVYPNPASSVLNVLVPNLEGNTASIALTNILGEVVSEEQLNGAQLRSGHQLNVADLTPGMYYMTIVSGDQRITKRVQVAK